MLKKLRPRTANTWARTVDVEGVNRLSSLDGNTLVIIEKILSGNREIQYVISGVNPENETQGYFNDYTCSDNLNKVVDKAWSYGFWRWT